MIHGKGPKSRDNPEEPAAGVTRREFFGRFATTAAKDAALLALIEANRQHARRLRDEQQRGRVRRRQFWGLG